MTTSTRQRPALKRVLDTADRLFYECGIHATGVDTIAAEANVSKATMYTYFATKDDLVAEYLRGRSSAWQQHLVGELDRRGGTPQHKVAEVFELLGEWIAAPGFHGCPFINAEAESTPEAPAHRVNLDHRQWVRQLFGDLLREAGIGDADALARQLAVLYDGVMTSAHAEPDQPWASDAREAARVLVTAARRRRTAKRT